MNAIDIATVALVASAVRLMLALQIRGLMHTHKKCRQE